MLAHYALLLLCIGCENRTLAVVDFYPDLINSNGYIVNGEGLQIGCEIKRDGYLYCIDTNNRIYQFRPIQKLEGTEI